MQSGPYVMCCVPLCGFDRDPLRQIRECFEKYDQRENVRPSFFFFFPYIFTREN